MSGGDVFNPQGEPGGDSADWLSGLRSGDWQADSTPSEDIPEPPAEGDSEIPDWLSRVRAHSQETAPDEPSGSTGDEPDWLKSLAADSGQTQGSADDWLAGLGAIPEDNPNESNLPLGVAGEEWLDNLRGTDQTAGESETQPSANQDAGPGEEWMADLAGWNAPAGDETPSTPPAEIPDFSASFPSNELPQAESQGEQPDWFAQLGGSEPEAAPEPAETGEPDWMPKTEDQPHAAGEPAENEDGLPAWLSGVTAGAAAAAEESAEPADLPDWLSQAKPAADQEETPAAADDMPDWLKNTNLPKDEPAQPPSTESETPDWFSQLTTGASDADEGFQFDPQSIPTPPGEESEPLNPVAGLDAGGLQFSDEPAGEPAGESQEPQPADEMPDFSALMAGAALDADTSGEVEESQPAGMPADQAADDLPDWLGKAEESSAPAEVSQPAGELPTWMKDFDQAADAPPPLDPNELSTPFVEENLPAWLDGMKNAPGADSDESGVSALIEPAEQELTPELNAPFQVELPEWLGEGQPVESGESAESAAQPANAELNESLAKAELPSWVEDLRPLESVIPGDVRSDTGETLVEKAGPLAGMRGVLQGEDLSSHYRKPPVYSARLRVSDRQRSQAAILENLLGIETASKDVPAEPSRAPQFILRIVIALVMILSLLTMLLPDFSLVDVSAAVPAGLTGIYDRVENLPADAAVLLAVDYEPGLSGEMRYASNSVIEHLMVKDARLAIVSTVPTGPVLADGLLAEVRNRRPEYILADRTVNLGYLPGGTTSLLEFAQDPKRATPYASDTPLSGMPAWDHAAVQGVNSLQDFALVIVLTDSPETGRAWIEQVLPVLGSVPLTMVTSAQAGPMLQPYFDSAQIQGMVVGLQGGAMYEQKSGRVSLANRFWGSYQTGILAGVLLLILGGIISGVLGMSNRKPAKKGKA